MVKPLLPERRNQNDLFICDFGNVTPKSDLASMENPLFSLSTKPDITIKEYSHNNNKVTVTPSVLGHATIHDKDILIYCISQLMAGINRGDEPSPTIKLKASDLLTTTNRGTGGRDYALLNKSFARLKGTVITTNIKTNNIEIEDSFNILDKVRVKTENPKTKRMVELEITLSEWLYNSIIGKEILSISRDYFRLRKPIERRIYELARKHCGNKREFTINTKKLFKKSGSGGSIKKFREALKHIEKHNHLPDYKLYIDGDTTIFSYSSFTEKTETKRVFLKAQTYENARKILKRHFDVYAIESEWWEWIAEKEPPKSPDGAFIGFCKMKVAEL